jgi:hypothetical protein
MSKSTLRTGIIILTVITGGFHIFIGARQATQPDILLLNGLGYFGLLWLLLWPPAFLKSIPASLVTYAFIAYTAVTVVMYFVSWGADGFTNIGGMFVKLVEVFLIIDLLMYRNK